MSNLTKFEFDGDQLQVARDGSRVAVVVRPVCEALGIDPDSQRKRLTDPGRCPWATTVIMTAVAEDGKTREMLCIDVDSLAMWLATVEVGRVREDRRSKLIRYQKECAQVLRDHFFGRPQTSQVSPELLAMLTGLAEAVQSQTRALTVIADRFEALERRVASIEAAGSGAIGISDAAWLKRELTSIAHYETITGFRKSFRSAHRRLQNELGAMVQWFGAGRGWSNLPAQRFPIARAWVLERRKALDAAMAARQLSLAIEPQKH